jgi:hypothetical protein
MNSTSTPLVGDVTRPSPRPEPATGVPQVGTPQVGVNAAEPSRREILKALGFGGATLLVAGTGVLSYRVLDTGVLKPGRGHAYDPWRHWRDTPGPVGAVAAAILAANPHNAQPWAFLVAGNTVDVFVDDSRNVGQVDPMRREQHVGLGCALENLVLACRSRGLEPTMQLLPDGAGSSRVARVDLSPAAPVSSPLYEAIGARHSNRGPYDGRVLSSDTLAGLVDTTGLPGVAVQWITDPGQMTLLGQLLVDAALALTRDEQQSRDSFAWFRSNNDAVQQHRDGMSLDPQGMTPLILSVAKLLPASSRAGGDSFWVDQTRNVHTRTAAAYGVLTAADPDDRATQLVTGRLLERIHLTATSRGVALQHMNQITERMDRERLTGAPATFGPRFAALLPTNARPLVVFRVGYPVRAARPSPRRSVTEVIR